MMILQVKWSMQCLQSVRLSGEDTTLDAAAKSTNDKIPPGEQKSTDWIV